MTNEFTKYIELSVISGDIEYIRAQIEIFESKLGLQLYMAQIYQKHLNDLKKMDDEDSFRKYVINKEELIKWV